MYLALNIIVIIAAILIFVLLNYYIGRKGLRALRLLRPSLVGNSYWIVFWIITFTYIVMRIIGKYLPDTIYNIFDYIGVYWMGAFYYLIIILPLLDIVKFICKRIKFVKNKMENKKIISIIYRAFVIIFVGIILVYGTWNAQNVQITKYNITIRKHQIVKQNKLHAVLVSDTHLGNIVDKKRLQKMADMINKLKPDCVFLAGDIIDEDLAPFTKQKMAKVFKSIKTKYGIYAILGNHEYIGGQSKGIVNNYKKTNIKLLKDSYVRLPNGYYVIGRDDLACEDFNGRKRKQLSKLMKDIKYKDFPTILLDHQPHNLKDAEDNHVDLELSGHTHGGQVFPDKLITERMYEDLSGYLKKGKLQVIVTSGYGTWGPPIRIGSKAEIVDINIVEMPKK